MADQTTTPTIDTRYFLQPGETPDAYRARTAEYTRSAPGTRIDPSNFSTPSWTNWQEQAGLSAGELNTIANRYQSRLKNETDLINAKFAPRIAEQKETNRAQLARTRVLNANTGVTDSGTGVSAEITTEKKGNEAVKAIEDERSAAISSALGLIDQAKQDAITAATAQKKNDLVAYNNLRTANATKAQEALKAYITAGGDIEKLKTAEPDSYKALADAVGGEGLLQSMVVGFAPKDTYLSDKPEIVGNKAIFFKKDPKTGKISQVPVDLPAHGSKVTQVHLVPGEGLYAFHEDGTYTKVGSGGTKGTTPTAADANSKTDAKNWLRRQPGYSPADEDAFESDPQFQAYAIFQAQQEKKAKTVTDPFAK